MVQAIVLRTHGLARKLRTLDSWRQVMSCLAASGRQPARIHQCLEFRPVNMIFFVRCRMTNRQCSPKFGTSNHGKIPAEVPLLSPCFFGTLGHVLLTTGAFCSFLRGHGGSGCCTHQGASVVVTGLMLKLWRSAQCRHGKMMRKPGKTKDRVEIIGITWTLIYCIIN